MTLRCKHSRIGTSEGKGRRGVVYLGEVWAEKRRYKSGEEVHGGRGQMERKVLIPDMEKKRDFFGGKNMEVCGQQQ